MSEMQTNEIPSKKGTSKNVLLALVVLCIITIAMVAVVVSLSLRVSELSQKYDKSNALLNILENHVPDNLDNLFPNKIILWNEKQLTSPSNVESNVTLAYSFNYTGYLRVYVTSPTSDLSWARITWSNNQFNPITADFSTGLGTDNVGVFPVLKGVTQLNVFFGALDFSQKTKTQNDTITILYYY
jgi:hypothetical protein